MDVPVQRVNTIVNGKRGITAETAILLSEALDTTPEFWMGVQADHDLWHAIQSGPGQRVGLALPACVLGVRHPQGPAEADRPEGPSGPVARSTVSGIRAHLGVPSPTLR